MSDNINFVHNLSQPTFGRQPGAVAIQYSIGDIVVPNRSSEALAELANLPIIGKAIKPLPYLRSSKDFENGYGAVQIPTALFSININNFLLDGNLGFFRVLFSIGHYSFFRADAQINMNLWLAHMRSLP